MDRNKIAKIGSIVMILSLLLSIFVGAMSVKAATPATDETPPPMSSSAPVAPKPSQTPVLLGPDSDLDADGVINNEDPDIDGDGVVNGLDPDIDGDGIDNGQDGNPASTNLVDSSDPGQFVVDRAWQWTGGIAVLAVLGWLVALPYIRRRRGTATKR
jgi:hypothetical protein